MIEDESMGKRGWLRIYICGMSRWLRMYLWGRGGG